ncbi:MULTISPECIES: lysozyme [Pasteurellaceae]|uniref:Lysozyme n=1 Tax=Pasteurella atlantica TaxID=2827233 RepID=A0AAW8CRB5_9PAST|nr:lysozyme [Pasteurella atlantica]MBR0573344.1 lysozyme [Pasteurella atlantica]MDP8040474.1 lysozyme [Pasteurella atlantica]MDP8041865.1 lysozyme [Pasteurella atlantica]MDP8043932.1 lysozyme [Pasteurella atlantica]MDP8046789.1 lysozyme [Pasteurella atlantica]
MKKIKIAGAIVCSVITVIGIVKTQYPQIKVSKQGLEVIGNAEGCRAKPYTCPANHLTVGIGSTEYSGHKIQRNKTYSLQEIAERWKDDLIIAQQCVEDYANGDEMPQGAYDSLVSITFNVGCRTMKKSTLFRLAKQGYSPKMCVQFPRWVYAGGRKLKGLIKRRAKEKALCLGG